MEQNQLQSSERFVSGFSALFAGVLVCLPTLFLMYVEFFSEGGFGMLFASFNSVDTIGILLLILALLIIPVLLLGWNLKNYKQRKNTTLFVSVVLILIWFIGMSYLSINSYMSKKAFYQSEFGRDPLYDPPVFY